MEGLIATPWEELYTADPPERGYQSTGYWGYRDTYIAPSRTILDSASDDEVAEVRRKQTEQKKDGKENVKKRK